MNSTKEKQPSIITELSERLGRVSRTDRETAEKAIVAEFAGRKFYVLQATRMLYGTEKDGSYPWVCAEDYEKFISELRDWAIRRSHTVADWEEWEIRIQESRKNPPTSRQPYHFHTSEIDVWISWELTLVKVNITSLLKLIGQKVATDQRSHQQEMLDIKARNVGYREMEAF